jgi:PPOX class probable F420-dependent enzyme
MATFNAAARALIESDALAHLVTVGGDGRPQVTCVWVGFDERNPDEIVFASLGEYQKIKNIRRDPRVTLSIETAEPPNEWGLIPYLVVNGRARVETGHGPALLQRLAETYLGPGRPYPPMEDPPEGFIVHITAERIGGVGNWSI